MIIEHDSPDMPAEWWDEQPSRDGCPVRLPMTKPDPFDLVEQDIEDAIMYYRDAKTAVMEASMHLSDAHKELNRAAKVLDAALTKLKESR